MREAGGFAVSLLTLTLGDFGDSGSAWLASRAPRAWVVQHGLPRSGSPQTSIPTRTFSISVCLGPKKCPEVLFVKLESNNLKSIYGKTVWKVLKELSQELPYNLAISLLGVSPPKNLKREFEQNLYTDVHTARRRLTLPPTSPPPPPPPLAPEPRPPQGLGPACTLLAGSLLSLLQISPHQPRPSSPGRLFGKESSLGTSHTHPGGFTKFSRERLGKVDFCHLRAERGNCNGGRWGIRFPAKRSAGHSAEPRGAQLCAGHRVGKGGRGLALAPRVHQTGLQRAAWWCSGCPWWPVLPHHLPAGE